MLIISLGFLLLFVVFLIVAIRTSGDYHNEEWNITSWVLSVVFGLVLLGLIIAIPGNRFYNLDEIKKIEAFQTTLDSQRKNATEYENAIITQKMVDYNMEIARWKNQYVWYRCKFWMHKDIKNLEPVK